MCEYIKGFPTIPGRIMICGSSTVGPSRIKGFPYTSGGSNIIWEILDYSLRFVCESRNDRYDYSFENDIEEYKNINFTKNDYEIISEHLENDYFLYQISENEISNKPNLIHARNIQERIINKMNEYGFGLTDAIIGRRMRGTADTSASSEAVYNPNLMQIVENAEITILNGISKTKKSTVGAFRFAVNLYGRRNDDNWKNFKNRYAIVELVSSSGGCHSYSDNFNMTDEDKMKKWCNALRNYL